MITRRSYHSPFTSITCILLSNAILDPSFACCTNSSVHLIAHLYLSARSVHRTPQLCCIFTLWFKQVLLYCCVFIACHPARNTRTIIQANTFSTSGESRNQGEKNCTNTKRGVSIEKKHHAMCEHLPNRSTRARAPKP